MPLLFPTDTVDDLADKLPDNAWVKLPSSSSAIHDITWHDFTWQQFSSAVDMMARWLDENLGPAALQVNEVITYTGVNDIRYPIIMLAALKAGYKSLLSSPRNSLEGHYSLMEVTKCHKLLYSKELKGQVGDIESKFVEPFQSFQVPDLEEVVAGSTTTETIEPYQRRGSEIMSDEETVVILHSSGTTGLPKPIYIKAGVLAVARDLVNSMPTPRGRLNTHDPLYKTNLVVSMPPFFHAFGLNLLVRSIYYQNPLVLLPSGTPPTADLMLHAIGATKPTAIVCTPSILEDICAVSNGLNILSKLDWVYYGGAPLARDCGNAVSKQVALVNGIGSTEIWNATSFIPADRTDWEYFEWNPAAGIVMEPTESENLAELVIKRKVGKASQFQFVFHNFPQLNEWRTKDLFERHPSNPALWRYVGRIDDIIVLSNGEKLNPVTFEKIVEGHPLVQSALMVGAGHFQTALVLEVHSGTMTPDPEETIIDQVWPSVEEANEQYPAHGRVWRNMIKIASAEKPFQRTPKGSVNRRNTSVLYKEEIASLYVSQATQWPTDRNTESVNEVTIQKIVRKAVSDITRNEYAVSEDDTSFLSMGFDSLRVLQLTHILTLELPTSMRTSISQRLVYDNPSTRMLTHALISSRDRSSTSNNTSREEVMSALTYKHRVTRRRSSVGRLVSPDLLPTPGIRVILTGSTGSLGTHLLHNLLADPSISHIFCLNRSPNARDKQRRLFTSSSFSPNQLDNDSRVTFLQADLSQPNLGLSSSVYQDLARQKVHKIIHNAWPVNFNLGLSEFEPAIRGMRNLVNLAIACSAEFVFVSSISSVMNYPSIRPSSSSDSDTMEIIIPEFFETDNSLPLKQGYAESKHVASSIIARAVQEKLLKQATLLRVGQIAGPTEGSGVWNRHEWFPSLVATSLVLGKTPSRLGGMQAGIDWVPVDLAARAVLEISASAESQGLICCNVVNPNVCQWDVIRGTIMDEYQDVKTVEIGEWLDALCEQQDSERYPSLKLMGFFEEWRASEGSGMSTIIRFDTEQAREKSQTMRDMPAVDGEMMRRWLQGWGFRF
ncbi:hypothetical protein QBC35DRAFT_390894 [Podospora australis]|uniref:Carrier domain-containing protein n=1 Tax=Podospora australis TaxID=1536484 RepID=A0AAN6WN09_9PEZI|nr:hypothetical protein QBC35DRAFT_390894 [Podospora australis]